MLYTADYYWFANYDQSDIALLDESINWDEALSHMLTPYVPVLSLLASAFNNSQLSTSWLSTLSWVETIFFSKILPLHAPQTLHLALSLDTIILLNTKYGSSAFLLFHSELQDWLLTIFYNAPELSFALSDWFSTVKYANQIEEASSSLFDSYQDIHNVKISEFVENIVLFALYSWLILIVMHGLRLRAMRDSINPYFARLYFFLFGYACENRIQVDAVFDAFFLVALFFTMMIITFDDDREEIIEFINLHLFYIFLATFVCHFWKYSIHYLSFLDSSRKGTSSTIFILGQFLFDVLNLIGFSLRFVLLMARLNIYDGIDDILDSYYILFIDFDEEEYMQETAPDVSSFSYFDTDVQDDRSSLLEDENDLTVDLYSLYAVLWGKYVFYLAFFLEEIARVGLALFVTLLLMLEINAVNRSYSEDDYAEEKFTK